MQRDPFVILRQFPELSTQLFTKEDRINKDANMARVFDGTSLAVPRQVHGGRTIIVRTPIFQTEDADGIVTDQPGLTLAVCMADCQTFVVYVPKQRIVGVLHAGWKGLLAGAIPAFFDVVEREWGIAPAKACIAAGPSLCLGCSEFSDPQRELPDMDRRFFSGRCVDLRGIADATFERIGIPQMQRERHPDCTRCHPDRYWSYRGPDRNRVKSGWENVLACTLS